MRALWSSLVTDSGLRQSAFALDAISLEVAFIIGPLLTGLLVTVGSPTVAILVQRRPRDRRHPAVRPLAGFASLARRRRPEALGGARSGRARSS